MAISTFHKINDLPVIWNGPEGAQTNLILAHGAGAPMDTDFMNFFAQSIATKGIRVLRFEFPYMSLRREGQGKRPPNTQKLLLESWSKIIQVCQEEHSGKIYIGGKSMGGRMATMIAEECMADGIVCLGYLFYAPGKQDKPRTDHLRTFKIPTLILQGERDIMGAKEVVSGFELSNEIKIHWVKDGDHSLKPRKKSGFTEQENFKMASIEIGKFLNS